MAEVKIGRSVDYKELERALVEAAKDVGWDAKVRDVFSSGYRIDSSVESTKDYLYTEIRLRGVFLPTMRALIHKDTRQSSFNIWTGFPFGVALGYEVRGYLKAVSAYLG